METLEIKLLNPKAGKLLADLAELNLISIKDSSKNKSVTANKNDSYIPSSTAPGVDIFPFKPQYLKHSKTFYILREKLNGIVSFEDGQYIISNEPLDITVWAETRDKAEEAFAFHSLYVNFALENDANLTPRARQLKQALIHLVVNTSNVRLVQKNISRC